MDRITTIESKFGDALGRIDGTIQTTGYTYYTNTGTIQVYDEVLSLARNTTTVGETNKGVNHQYEWQDSGLEGQDWSTGQKAYTNRMVIVLRSKLHNYVTGAHPKNEMRILMNQCLSDLLFTFGVDYQLGQTSQWCKFLGAYREYEDITNNRIQTGTLVTQWEVVFNQSFTNPDNDACW